MDVRQASANSKHKCEANTSCCEGQATLKKRDFFFVIKYNMLLNLTKERLICKHKHEKVNGMNEWSQYHTGMCLRP